MFAEPKKTSKVSSPPRSAAASSRTVAPVVTSQQLLQRTADQQAMSQLLAPRLPAGGQFKLRVGAVDDPLEHEADRVAEQVMRTPDAALSVASAPAQISRKCASCDPEEGALQRKPEPAAPDNHDAPAAVHAVLRSPGQPLDASTRAFFEPRFGRDLASVRVHADAAAQQSARAVSARAFTVGSDVVFGAGQYQPHTDGGRRLLAHELTHVVQQRGLSTLQRQPDPRAVRPLPDWVFSTPMHALPGDPVPGYEIERPTYVEADRRRMLNELNARVQLNGLRLADFYRDLRVAWMDLILELAIEDAGLSLGAQTVFGIIGNLLSAPLKTGPGLMVGIIADGIINVADELKGQSDLEQRKKSLRDMMAAPTVKDVGEKDANGQLAGLLLDAIGYATWLQAAPLESLAKFRIPAEFPAVAAADIRFEIAAAVLRYRTPGLWAHQMDEVAEVHGTYVGGFKLAGSEVLQVRITQGNESTPEWNLRTHPALLTAIEGRAIRELSGLPLIVTFIGRRDHDVWSMNDSAFEDTTPRVTFGRDTAGSLVVHKANAAGLYQLHSYCHPGEKSPSREDIFGPMYGKQRSWDEAQQLMQPVRTHYRHHAACGAAVLMRNFIDPFRLPGGKARK